MIEVTLPNAGQLERELGVAQQNMLAGIKREINKIAIDLSAHVKDKKLSGQALNVRTGRLRRSINFRVNDNETGVEALVGTNVAYGRVHEFGFKGVVNVKEHLRRTKRGQQHVRAHTRRVDLPERAFLRPSLDEMRNDIEARIARVVGTSIAGGAS